MAHAKASIGTTNYQTAIVTGHHRITADEGPALGGKDVGPGPYELLTSALAACTAITLRMYAERKHWPVTAVHTDVHFVREGDKQHIDRVLTIEGGVDAEDRKSTRLNSSHSQISYAVFCLKKKTKKRGSRHMWCASPE